MSQFTKSLINEIGDALQVTKNFDVIVRQVMRNTRQSKAESERDVSQQLAIYRKQNGRPQTAIMRVYKSIIDNTGKPKDLSGP